MEKLRVVILDMQPIDPPTGGGRLRLLGLYSGFQNGAEATYVGTYDWPGPAYREHRLSPCLTEIDVPLSQAHFEAHGALAAQLGKGCIDTAFPMQGHLSREFIARAQAEAKRADVVIFSHPWLFPFVAPALAAQRQLICYDSHNCEGLLRVKILDDGSPLADKICREAVRCEYELCHFADVIFACSPEDQKSFEALYHVPGEKIIPVPNGVFTSQIKPCDDAEKRSALRNKLRIDRPAACFIGSGYLPNEEAARLILEAAAHLPQYQFVILGGVGEKLKHIGAREYPNVIVTGFLEERDKLEYLAACDIAVNPMISGSGTNIKMFDFMAAGLPIITTDIGARGIANTGGRVYRLCQRDARSLAEAVDALMKDPAGQAELRKWGRLEAEERYSWEKISAGLGATLEKKRADKLGTKDAILMVSTYPPEKCGIGAYAQQQAEFLRHAGERVDVLALKGDGAYRMALDTPEKIAVLKELADRYKKVIIQYHPAFYYGAAQDFAQRMEIHKAFTALFRQCKNIEVVCHEIQYPADRESAGIQRIRDNYENTLKREKWMQTGSVVFHTRKERQAFCQKLNIPLDESRHKVVAPHHYYRKKRDIPQGQARRELQLPMDAKVFLCIGFIQPHKAFDRVAQAFGELADKGNRRLYIVGSLRLTYDETTSYLEKLREYARQYGDRVFLREGFVSDEMFDTWIIASDVVVIPYQEIWTSGVMGRAKLFGKQCLVRDVGGLVEQMEPGDCVFREYADLARIIEGKL